MAQKISFKSNKNFNERKTKIKRKNGINRNSKKIKRKTIKENSRIFRNFRTKRKSFSITNKWKERKSKKSFIILNNKPPS